MTPGPGGQFDHLLKNMKSRVESKEPIIETPESRAKTIDDEKVKARVKSIESIVKSLDSKSNTGESRVETEESRVGLVHGQKPEAQRVGPRDSLESRVDSLDIKALEEAIKEAATKPKLGVYSPLAAAMLRYKAITTPRYSMGSEMKAIIEQALKETYPELYEEVQKRMDN